MALATGTATCASAAPRNGEQRSVVSHITFTVGPPGAGKTRWAHQEVARRGLQEVQRVNLDDFLTMTHGREFGPLSHPDLRIVKRMLIDLIRTIAESGRDVIVDSPNLSTRFPNQVRDELGDQHEYAIQDLTSKPLDFCIDNDRHRHTKNPWAYVGSDEVSQAWNKGQALRRRFGGEGLPLWVEELNRSDGIVPYVGDPSLPTAVVVDIDGTLAATNPQGPCGTTRCVTDDLQQRLANMLQQFTRDHGSHVVILTGRDEEHGDSLYEWLTVKSVRYDEAHMRPRGDTRRDNVVKLELFNRHVRNRFNVIAAFDDRDRVVRLWRRLGLLTCAVTFGDV